MPIYQPDIYTFALVSTVGAFAPADATTYYFGGHSYGSAATTAGNNKFTIKDAGTIYAAQAQIIHVGTNGSAETSTLNVRLNDTTDTALVSSFALNASPSVTFTQVDLAIAVVAGDYVELKWTTPTWVTNPTNVGFKVDFWVRRA